MLGSARLPHKDLSRQENSQQNSALNSLNQDKNNALTTLPVDPEHESVSAKDDKLA